MDRMLGPCRKPFELSTDVEVRDQGSGQRSSSGVRRLPWTRTLSRQFSPAPIRSSLPFMFGDCEEAPVMSALSHEPKQTGPSCRAIATVSSQKSGAGICPDFHWFSGSSALCFQCPPAVPVSTRSLSHHQPKVQVCTFVCLELAFTLLPVLPSHWLQTSCPRDQKSFLPFFLTCSRPLLSPLLPSFLSFQPTRNREELRLGTFFWSILVIIFCVPRLVLLEPVLPSSSCLSNRDSLSNTETPNKT